LGKITPESFIPKTENQRQLIWQTIGWSENSPKSKSETYIEFFEKLILNKSSPAPNSPSGEQKTEITKTSEQKLSYEKWTPTQQKAIELAYEKTKAREQAKAECKIAVIEAKVKLLETQNRLKEEDRKTRNFYRNANKTSSIDMGDSAGVPEEYIF
jgi:hypothetical protein